jgi:two-component system phosphate regulon sensor histidine kinase PhoR
VRTVWLFIFVVASLLGLFIMQLKLLYTGIKAEKIAFDQQVYQALHELEDAVAQSDSFSRQILQLQQQRIAGKLPEKSLTTAVAKQLETTMRGILDKLDLPVGFAIAITESYLAYPLLATDGYQSESALSFHAYLIRLEGHLRESCQCDLILHFQAKGFFPLLVRKLYPVLLPSVAFLIMLVLCYVLLMRGIRQQRKLAIIKNDFINNLAHELKTPAFSMSLLIRLLREAIANNKDHTSSLNYLRLMEQENKLIKEHIEKILELANLENSHYEIALSPIVINPLLNRLVDAFQTRVLHLGGQFTCRLPEEDITVAGNGVHLQNAVQNLLDNALKYGGQPPVVHLEAYESRAQLVIAVKDNGTGIEQREQKKIFKKFYRSKDHQRLAVKGFGLGLNYVKEVISAHKGRVKVESQKGKGSTFSLVLPIAQ